jgi:hypothetical protein
MYRILLCFAVIVGVGACSSVRAPSPDEWRAVEHPSPYDAAWLNSVAPRVVAWFTEQESALLPRGRPLTVDEGEVAKRMGVQHAERVRILILDDFPFPEGPLLPEEIKAFGFGCSCENGRSMGYAILIKPQYDGQLWLLAHELVHVAQRERLGTEVLIHRYLMELRVFGYARAPLELEANQLMQNAK